MVAANDCISDTTLDLACTQRCCHSLSRIVEGEVSIELAERDAILQTIRNVLGEIPPKYREFIANTLLTHVALAMTTKSP